MKPSHVIQDEPFLERMGKIPDPFGFQKDEAVSAEDAPFNQIKYIVVDEDQADAVAKSLEADGNDVTRSSEQVVSKNGQLWFGSDFATTGEAEPPFSLDVKPIPPRAVAENQKKYMQQLNEYIRAGKLAEARRTQGIIDVKYDPAKGNRAERRSHNIRHGRKANGDPK